MKRQLAEASGRAAEDEAARWLSAKGWTVLAKRVKTRAGEIDLIMQEGETLVFVEVKYRRRAADLDTAIDEYRLARVAAAAESVAADYADGPTDLRIDVVLLAPGAEPRHIENAWQP